MRFNPGERIYFKSLTGDRVYKGSIIRGLKDGFYLVDDGTGEPPRHIHGSRLGKTQVPHDKTQVFA